MLDTGPLIALPDRRDRHHVWASDRFGEIVPPLLTCEAVVSEACHLARRTAGSSQAVFGLFERGVLRLAFHLDEYMPAIAALLERYADVPMSLADACLVRMSELVEDSAIFTLDRDFQVYRRHGRKVIPLLIPPEG